VGKPPRVRQRLGLACWEEAGHAVREAVARLRATEGAVTLIGTV
jgi:hypothetical protein